MFREHVNFRLDGYEALTPEVGDVFWRGVAIDEPELSVLAEHHSADGAHSYYVLFNEAVTWGIPGEPPLVALHIQRDTQARTFQFSHAKLPLAVMAQSFVIAHGCPPEAIAFPSEAMEPDDATRVLEQRLLVDGNSFALLHSYTDDTSHRPQTVVLLQATDARTPLPFRVLLEEADMEAGTRTLREGGFTTKRAAVAWMEERLSGADIPLPSASPPVRPPAHPTVGPPPAAQGPQRLRRA